jgi:DNA-binding MarR family transcriptional regulator
MASDPRDSPTAAEIDRLVHEPARLVLLSQLYVVRSADFLFLQQETGLSQGNLSSHMSKLEAAGYIEVEKEFVGRRPRTTLRLTPVGRRAFKQYVAKMKLLLDTTLPPAR